MKKSKNHIIMLTILLAISFLYFSCNKSESWLNEDYHNDYRLPHTGDIAWPSGSMLTFLNGNVNLDVLPGSVSSPVRISVNECNNGQFCDLLLKMITIEPSISFDGPVNVSLRYDGDLAVTEESIDECKLIVYGWVDKEDFHKGSEGMVLCCSKDENNCSVNFCIKQAGFYAVRIKSE